MGEKEQMNAAIEYQRGAVVSKTLIDKDGGNVTLFAFDIGQGLSEHTTPYDALVYILEGEAEIMVAGKTMILREGDYTITPANKPHALRAINKFKMLLTMIKA